MWEVSAIGSGAPVFFYQWGIPFVVLGGYLVFGRFVHKRRRKARTTYAVTSARALIAVGDDSLQDTPIVHQPVLIRRKDHHVSVTIGSVALTRSGMNANTGLDVFASLGGQFGLYDVADVDGLLVALEAARGAAR